MGDQAEERAGGGSSERRTVVYCLIPPELAPRLHELLRRHFSDDPDVEVVVEQRSRERRSGRDRRRAAGEPPGGIERRRIRAPNGRRVGERRAALVPVEVPELPRRARRYAARLAFVERLEPATEHAEDLDTARLVTRVQAGDQEAFSTLYTRYFSRVYAYLRVVLEDAHEAEDATQHVFMRLMESLPRYERRRQPFRGWLFTVVRNQARDYLDKRARVAPMEAEELNHLQEELGAVEHEEEEAAAGWPASQALSWISNQDLIVLMERLPAPQRQVLALRYMLGLRPNEIAKVMGISPNRVSVLHYRALGFLRERLTSLGREPHRRGGARMTRVPQKATVLRLRRFSLKP